MRGDWIEATSSTGGTGALTLSGVSGSPNFDDVFGASGTMLVEYTIDEFTDSTRAVLSKAEAGIGSINLSTLVLTRSKPRTTWSAGVYDDTDPSPVSFGTTAANIRVICGPTSFGAIPTAPFLDTAFGDGLVPPANMVDGTPSANTIAANTVYYVPILLIGQYPLGKLGVYVGTVAAGKSVRAAIYSVGTDGKPDQLVIDVGALSVGSSAMVSKTAASWASPTSPRRLIGWYYAAFVSDGTPSLTGSVAQIPALLANNFDRPIRYIYRPMTYGTFAQSAPSNGSGSFVAVSNLPATILYVGP